MDEFRIRNEKKKEGHFVLVPLLAQGHMIPMIDMGRVLAERGVRVTLVTTPLNASRFDESIDRLPISLLTLPFPCEQVGLPLGCENLDTLPSPTLLRKFYNALHMLQQPLEDFLQRNHATCIISDKCLSWTSLTADKFGIPRLVFHGTCCFSLLASYNIMLHNPHLSVPSDSHPFLIPGLPLQNNNIHITRSQLPGPFLALPDLDDFRHKMREAEMSAYGVVVNSFQELEHGCAEDYEKAINKKVWCIGPVSLCNKESMDKFERGNKPSIQHKQCLEWLDSKKPRSVLYVCLGSLCRLPCSQLIQLGLALEASERAFIWVVKTAREESNTSTEIEKWIKEEGYEERVKGRGMVIKGWAPQILILSHEAVGGFLTHCGWNSTIEGVSAGVPMMTWPLFAEQFVNEKLIVKVLKIGVRVGVEAAVRWGEEEKKGVLVNKERIEEAIHKCMEGGEEGKERRNRAIQLRNMAQTAIQEQGSSHFNLSSLIQDILNLST